MQSQKLQTFLHALTNKSAQNLSLPFRKINTLKWGKRSKWWIYCFKKFNTNLKKYKYVKISLKVVVGVVILVIFVVLVFVNYIQPWPHKFLIIVLTISSVRLQKKNVLERFSSVLPPNTFIFQKKIHSLLEFFVFITFSRFQEHVYRLCKELKKQ